MVQSNAKKSICPQQRPWRRHCNHYTLLADFCPTLSGRQQQQLISLPGWQILIFCFQVSRRAIFAILIDCLFLYSSTTMLYIGWKYILPFFFGDIIGEWATIVSEVRCHSSVFRSHPLVKCHPNYPHHMSIFPQMWWDLDIAFSEWARAEILCRKHRILDIHDPSTRHHFFRLSSRLSTYKPISTGSVQSSKRQNSLANCTSRQWCLAIKSRPQLSRRTETSWTERNVP